MAEETTGAAGPDIKQLLAEDQKKRATKCETEINDLLKKYDCTLVTLQQFVNGQPGAMMVQVMPNVPK